MAEGKASRTGRRRAWAVAGGAIALVWLLRGFISVITPDNPNPYITPLAVVVTLLALLVPGVRAGRLGESRWGAVTLVGGAALVLTGGIAQVVPAEFALHRGALLVHFVVGLLVLLPLHLYLFGHLSEAIRRRPVDLVRGGGAALFALLGCVWTGALVLMLQAKDLRPLEAPHWILGWAAVALSVGHARRGRAVLARRESPAPLGRRLAVTAGLGVAVTALAFVFAANTRAPGSWEAPVAPLPEVPARGADTSHGGLLHPGPENWAAATCASPGGYCHIDSITQWKRTTHAQSANRVFDAVYARFLADRPGDGAYCDSCHAPRRAVAAEGPREQPPKRLAAEGATIPPVAPLEGLDAVGCQVCHLLKIRPDSGHTGGWTAHPVSSELTSTAQVPFFNFPMVIADLDRHANAFLESPQRDAEHACRTCHTHRVPDAVHPPVPGLEIADKVAEWTDSRYGKIDSPGRRGCPDCHMPRVYGPIDPTWTRSHAFPSGNTGVAWLRGDLARIAEQEAFLSDDRLEIEASCSPREGGRTCVVRVTNVGVGHDFPAGPRDIEDTWLRARVREAGWARGEDAEDDGEAAPILNWGVTLRDQDGVALDAHEFWRAAAVDGLDAIGPDKTAETSFDVPATAGTLELAVLRRRYNPRFRRAVLGEDVGDAPISVVAQTTIELSP